jgi:hypothetical protein
MHPAHAIRNRKAEAVGIKSPQCELRNVTKLELVICVLWELSFAEE